MDLNCVLVLQEGILRQLLTQYLKSFNIKIECVVDCSYESISTIISYKPSLIIIGTPIEGAIIDSIAHTISLTNLQTKVLILTSNTNLVNWPSQHKHQLLDILCYKGPCESILNSVSQLLPITEETTNPEIFEPESLSTRELEIFKCIGLALSSKEIASRLDISERTVETHRRNICRKLGVRGAALMRQAALYVGNTGSRATPYPIC